MHLKFFFRFLYQIITQSNQTVIQNKKKIIVQLRMLRKQIKKQDIAMRPHAKGVIVT